MAKQEAPLFYARRPLNYGPPDAPTDLDQGQVIELGGYSNDEKLTRLGYLAPVDTPRLIQVCGKCGTRFANGGYLDKHGRARHGRKPRLDFEFQAGAVSPLEGLERTADSSISGTMVTDTTGDREEAMLEREAPLYLEKTLASQRG